MQDDRIVDINARRRRTMASKKAVQDLIALQNGTAARSPIVLLCHIRGEADPFPRRWHFGSITLGQGAPVWKPLRFRRRREPLAIPQGTTIAGPVRAVLREELSAFCPNPRKASVVPLDSPAGKIYVGLQRDNADTLLTAIEIHGRERKRGASAAE